MRKKYVVEVAKYNHKKGKSDISHMYVLAYNKMQAVKLVEIYIYDNYRHSDRPTINYNNDRESEVWEYEEPVFIDIEWNDELWEY